MSRLIIVDAIDGAGKSTVIQAMAAKLASSGKHVFDLVEYTKREHNLPESDNPDLAATDILLSAEPTFCWVGAAIREEIIKRRDERAWDGRAAAEAFALDRGILFRRVILPFLEGGTDRWVIQDRGAITSLAYQPLQDEKVTLDWLLSLEGNRIELSRPPDLLLLLRLTAQTALERLAGRENKQDGHVFEELSFQDRLTLRYRDEHVLAPYRKAGTRIVEIDASRPAGAVVEDACTALLELT